MSGADRIPESAIEQVDTIFADMVEGARAPGVAYGIVVDSALVHSGGHGAAAVGGDTPGASTVFRIASMTKSFTATAVLMLRDGRRLRIDEPIGSVIPELATLRLPTSDAPPLTLRQLLTMSAGLPSDDPWGDRQESLSPQQLGALMRDGFHFSSAPGTEFEYSNLGYAVIGRAVANVSGQTYHDFVRSRVLRPLGMRSTVFDRADVPDDVPVAVGHRRRGEEWLEEPFDHSGEFSPIGGLYSSVDDLARWVAGFTDAFPARDGSDSGHPLGRASRREMQQLQRFNDVTAGPADDEIGGTRARAVGYGFGLAVEHHTRWGAIAGHSGGYPGFGSNMRWHVATGIGVIALANGTYAPARLAATSALETILAAVAAPSRQVTRWSATRAAAVSVEQLITAWDDTLADDLFAMNVDLDQPRAERRAEVEALAAKLGAIESSALDAGNSEWSAHLEWWVTGANGRALLEISLTPEVRPRVQSLDIRFVPQPSPRLATVVEQLRGALAGQAFEWPASIGVADDVDVAAFEAWAARAAGSAAAGPKLDPDPVSATSPDAATFRVRRDDHEWHVSVAVDDTTGDVTSCAATLVAPSITRWIAATDE